MSFKIVRDRVEETARALGVSGVWRVSADPIGGLCEKLLEEAGEFLKDRDVSELYDVWDVVIELSHRLDPDAGQFAEHQNKRARLGTFREGIEWSPVPGEGSD